MRSFISVKSRFDKSSMDIGEVLLVRWSIQHRPDTSSLRARRG